MVLMAGGATNIPPIRLRIPQVAALDPRLAIPHFAGRPILMLNGRSNPFVSSTITSLLWLAPQPNEQRWYDSGHLFPEIGYEDSARWVAEKYALLK